VEYLTTATTSSQPPTKQQHSQAVCSLLQLLLGAEVGGVSARLLAAIGGAGVEPGVALPADHLVAGLPIKKPTQKTPKKPPKKPLKKTT
jgi:hypothetical protein